jgi:hypothetical protein
MGDTITIQEEENFEKCTRCGFSGKSCNNAKHWETNTCIEMIESGFHILKNTKNEPH